MAETTPEQPGQKSATFRIQVRAALRAPTTLRQAMILAEVLALPVALRPSRWSLTGRSLRAPTSTRLIALTYETRAMSRRRKLWEKLVYSKTANFDALDHHWYRIRHTVVLMLAIVWPSHWP